MDQQREQIWLDLLEGMETRACYFHNDNDHDRRNRKWYAKKVYGDKYDRIRSEYTDRKMAEID